MPQFVRVYQGVNIWTKDRVRDEICQVLAYKTSRVEPQAPSLQNEWSRVLACETSGVERLGYIFTY